MKMVICECDPRSSHTINAHTRQAIFITNYLKSRGHDVKLIYSDEKCTDTDFDVIIKSYASFYNNNANDVNIINNNPSARLFWLTNEYDLELNGSIYKLDRYIDVIENFCSTRKRFKNHYLVNLNSLFYQPKDVQSKKYKICYYGTYRKDRAVYFKKYFTSKDFILSSSPKNFKKYASIGCTFKPCNKFKWGVKKDTLGLFEYSLYIEDTHTHTVFNNLSDRFYEALSNKTVTLFDQSCINTLKNSELKDCNYQNFIINSLDNLNKRDYKKDWEEQSKWIQVVENEQKKKTTNALKIFY